MIGLLLAGYWLAMKKKSYKGYSPQKINKENLFKKEKILFEENWEIIHITYILDNIVESMTTLLYICYYCSVYKNCWGIYTEVGR